MLKIKKIKKNGRDLDIYVKKPKFMPFMFLEDIDKMFKDEDNFFGTMIDKTGRYVILKFVLRSKEDIIPYVKYGMKSEILEDLREDNYAYHQLMKIQNKREYRSKFLKEFQEEFGTNTFPDYDEIYKRYDKLKKENEKLKYNARGQVNDYFKDKYADEVLKNAKLQKENEKLEKRNKEIYDGFLAVSDERCEYAIKCEKATEYIKEKISSTQGVINDYMYHKEHNKILIELLKEDIEMYKKELHILNGGDEDGNN